MATTDGAPDTDAILGMLRAGGGRATTTRRVTIDVILAAGREHLGAEDIVDRVRAQLPDVAESTIYRTLTTLEELDVVNHVHLGHGPSTYHLTRNRHQHLVCRTCGEVTEVPDAELSDLAERLDMAYGFAIEPHHFAIQGTCRRCRSEAG